MTQKSPGFLPRAQFVQAHLDKNRIDTGISHAGFQLISLLGGPKLDLASELV
jgi:hypothetical protein